MEQIQLLPHFNGRGEVPKRKNTPLIERMRSMCYLTHMVIVPFVLEYLSPTNLYTDSVWIVFHENDNDFLVCVYVCASV